MKLAFYKTISSLTSGHNQLHNMYNERCPYFSAIPRPKRRFSSQRYRLCCANLRKSLGLLPNVAKKQLGSPTPAILCLRQLQNIKCRLAQYRDCKRLSNNTRHRNRRAYNRYVECLLLPSLMNRYLRSCNSIGRCERDARERLRRRLHVFCGGWLYGRLDNAKLGRIIAALCGSQHALYTLDWPRLRRLESSQVID